MDIIKCPFFLITYTLPEEVYYLGFDPVFKANWARGYTYKSDGEIGPGFYADIGRFATWHSAYAGAAAAERGDCRIFRVVQSVILA